MRKCPNCKQNTIQDTILGEVCTNDDCGYIDGWVLSPKKKAQKTESTEAKLSRAYKHIEQLQKRISQLEREDHCCGSCGYVTRPSHPADGC